MTGLVLTAGGFDDIRSRDLRFLEEAAKLGALKVKVAPVEGAKFPPAERLYILNAVRFVTHAEAVSSGDVAGPAGAVWAERERNATVSREQAASEQGMDYRVIAESALDGFAVPAAKVVEGPTVAVSGCYDWLHSGHVRFFEEAASHGALHVFLGSDATICALKGPGHPQFPQDERRYVAASLSHVFAAIISRGSGWLDFAEDVTALKPDVFVVNEDGDKPAKRDFCRDLGIEYRVLKRVPAVGLPRRSSTDLRGF